jgi:uncharacterized OB-fold protein
MEDKRYFGNRCTNCGHGLPDPGDLCGNCFGNWPTQKQGSKEPEKKETVSLVAVKGMFMPDANKCPKCGTFLAEPGDDCPRCRVEIFPGTNQPPYPDNQPRI